MDLGNCVRVIITYCFSSKQNIDKQFLLKIEDENNNKQQHQKI